MLEQAYYNYMFHFIFLPYSFLKFSASEYRFMCFWNFISLCFLDFKALFCSSCVIFLFTVNNITSFFEIFFYLVQDNFFKQLKEFWLVICSCFLLCFLFDSSCSLFYCCRSRFLLHFFSKVTYSKPILLITLTV